VAGSTGSFLNWKPQNIEDFPIPQHPVEHEHHFVVRCLENSGLKKRFKESNKKIAEWAKKRYAMKAEEAYKKGKEEDFERDARERGTWQWQRGLYSPETGKGTRGGEPVQKESDAANIASGTLPPIQDVAGKPGTPHQYGKKEARGMGDTEATKSSLKITRAKQTEAQQAKVGKTMHEFKEGSLRSGSGAKVEDRDQALAISLRQAGLSRPKHK
jgi:hypothetical protein